MTNLTEIMNLLNNSNLQEIENTIVEKINSHLYKDDIKLIAKLILEEIVTSNLTGQQIEKFINTNKEKIISFAIIFLDKYNPQSLSAGLAITYSIYLIYLNERKYKHLLEYIKRRRIPRAQNFFEELVEAKKQMDEKNINS